MYKTTKEVASDIRAELKVEFPECRFSVRKSSFSMGSSITVALTKAPFEVMKSNGHWNSGYAQLNEYQLKDSRQAQFCNGANLTQEGWDTMRKVVKIMDSTNHFDTRYSFMHVEIGKWDKPFELRS